jgi:hypothetical protein
MEPVVEAPAIEAGRPMEGGPVVEAATMPDSGIDTGVLVEAPAMPDSGSGVGQDGSWSQGPSPSRLLINGSDGVAGQDRIEGGGCHRRRCSPPSASRAADPCQIAGHAG